MGVIFRWWVLLQVREDVEEEEEEVKEASPEPAKEPEETKNGGAENPLKRPAEGLAPGDVEAIIKAAKIAKAAQDLADGVAGEDGKEPNSEDEEGDVDCCVVCGLHRSVTNAYIQ